MSIINKAKKSMINQSLIKESNLKTLFNLIYHREPISRSELAGLTDLSPTTISSLVDELIQSGLVVSVGTSDTKNIGRKPIMLKVNANGAYIAAFRWGRSGLNYLLYDLKCGVVEHHVIEINSSNNFAKTIYDTIINTTYRKIEKRKLLAVCISIPAIIDSSSYAIDSSVLRLRENSRVITELTELFPSTPIVIGNESVFFTYAEKEFGGAKNVNNLFYVNISDGVGSGIMLDGKIYKGSMGIAGEFGHTTIDIHGPECECGNRGCLENYISLPAIVSSYTQHAQDKGLPPANSIDEIAVAYSNNDPVAVEVIHEVAQILNYGLYNVINLLNIDRIVIGGGIRKFGKPFLDELNQCTNTRAVLTKINRCNITLSTLDNDASCLGAAKYFIDNIMKISIDLENNLFLY